MVLDERGDEALYLHYDKVIVAAAKTEWMKGSLCKACFDKRYELFFARVVEIDAALLIVKVGKRLEGTAQKGAKHGQVYDRNTKLFHDVKGQSGVTAAFGVQKTDFGVSELAELINVSLESRDWKLIVAWLLQALRGTGPYPVLVLNGGQGSGKSTAAKMLRALLDPNLSPLRSLSRDERDLFIAAINGWALAFDNISGLSQWISDALCKLATGGGLSVRELYSDADETLLDALRPVVLNGITDFVDKQDLVDRALQVYLPSIPKTERKLEKEL